MDVPGEDPLRSRTAARLFELVAAERRPLSTAELADAADVHPNSARLHLGRLRDAGLLEVGSRHGDRGRPRKTWSISPDALIAGRPPEGYRELAGWLSESIAAADHADVRGQGRRIGRGIASRRPGARVGDVLGGSLAAMGFQPRRADEEGRTRFTLCNCPYREIARSQPGVVCSLHLGIAEGLISAADPTSKLTRFEVSDPITAGCVIEIDSPAVPESTEVPR